MSRKPYDHKYIWIIGASSGIGEALARRLALQGATLALSARRGDMLETLIQSIPGEHHISLPFDVSDTNAVTRAAEIIKSTFPHLDSAVFLAAIYKPHSQQTRNIDFIHQMIAVNLGGAFNMVHNVLPIFETQGFGQIALCGSVAGYRGLPYGQPYCATKAAIINYAQSLHVELSPKNIDVKVINPGFVKTPLTDKNDFPMPMMISADKATMHLAKGLRSRSFEIHFPKTFTYIMKLLQILPISAYLWLMKHVRV